MLSTSTDLSAYPSFLSLIADKSTITELTAEQLAVLDRLITSLQRSVRTYAVFSDTDAKASHARCVAELDALVSAVAIAVNKQLGDPTAAAI